MSAPQIRLLGAVPRVVLARLQMFFNTNKTFLLPTALPAVQELRQIYADNSPGKLLVVGHADTAGPPAYNDKLSLERAQATIAFLEDDFQTWLDFYDTTVDSKKRWGKVEDHLMIISMPDFDTKPKGEDAVSWYQRTRKLTVDGKAGTDTRTQLIQEYMSLDGASLEASGIKIEAVAHGCGENFPLDDSGENLDTAPANDKPDPIDRRAELFFFDPEFGIVPAPPGENSGPASTQYPAWRKRVEETVELRADDADGPKVTFIEMADAHFRTNSAVVLPEGEDPDKTGAHQALTSVGVIASALRFNDEHPGRTLLVAGHADTTNTPAFNQPLSEERAQVTLAMLKGGDDSRENFKNLAEGRHTGADIKQILSWVASALPGFSCDPGPINDNPASGAVLQFQNDYNTQRPTIAPNSADLNPDGSVGPLTWGAFFDCYEFALQQELGETAAGVQALRDKLVFADPQHEFLGFSEYFPIDELGVDNFRSQTNRRVEILFFEPGEEPDIAHAADDPETSDLYLPGHYERTPLSPRGTAKLSGNLTVYTSAQPGEAIELQVRSASGQTVATFPREAGVTIGTVVLFELDPDNLPNPTLFAFKRGDLIEEHGPPFNPSEVRDDLDNGQLADASDVVSGAASSDGRVAGPGAASSGTSGPIPASSDLRLVVKYENPKHRFLQSAVVSMNGALAVPPPDSFQGNHVFDVPAGVQQVQLQVSIPPQAPGAKKNILLFSQTYTIFQNTPNAVKGAPTRMLSEVGTRHDRVRSIGIATQAGTLIITLDLRFLDVTDHVTTQLGTFRGFRDGLLDPKDTTNQTRLPAPDLSGCTTVILEDTAPAGDGIPNSAFSWGITVPPAVAKSGALEANLFLFFQHELEHNIVDGASTRSADGVPVRYLNSDDIDYDRLSRYLPAPPQKDIKPSKLFLPSYVFRSLDPADGSTTELFNNFPSFNWNRQIIDSKKPIILAMPFPKRKDLGPMGQPLPGNVELLRSLLVALHAEGVIATKRVSAPRLTRVAIGGWSSGTEAVAKWCAGLVQTSSQLKDLVREVYFFDGFEDTKVALATGGPVENWFKAAKGRKLRLICTAYTEQEAIALARRLGTTEALDVAFDAGKTPVKSDVRALPGRNTYFYTNSLYKAALTLPPPGPALSLRPRSQPQQTVLDISDETNIFLDAEIFAQGTPTASITLSFDDGKKIHRTPLKLYSATEAASELHFNILGGKSIGFESEFTAAMFKLVNTGDKGEPIRVPKLRHPWAVFGGALRNGTFVGYLQFCLEESGF